jgi:hypothetical protein
LSADGGTDDAASADSAPDLMLAACPPSFIKPSTKLLHCGATRGARLCIWVPRSYLFHMTPFGAAILNGEVKQVSLDDYKGKYVILFWYPKVRLPASQTACGWQHAAGLTMSVRPSGFWLRWRRK